MRSLLFEHLPTKVGALALSVLVYSYLYARANVKVTEDLPVHTRTQAVAQEIVLSAGENGMVFLDRSDMSIRIQAEGVESDVNRFMDRAFLRGDVDLRRFVPGPGQGAVRVQLSPEDIAFRGTPAGVTVTYPNGLPEVSVSRREEWMATLRVSEREIVVRPGMRVRSSSVDPEQIRLIGPAELRHELTLLEVGPGIIRTRQEDRSFEQTIYKTNLAPLLENRGVEVDGSPRIVVRVEIDAEDETWEIFLPHGLVVNSTVATGTGEAVSVFASNLDFKVDVKGRELDAATPVAVKLTGPVTALQQIKAAVTSPNPDDVRYRILFDITEFLSDPNRSEIRKVAGRIRDLPPGVTHAPIEVNISLERG